MGNGTLMKVNNKWLGELRINEDEVRRGDLSLVQAKVKLEAGTHYTPIQGKILLSPEGADKLNAVAGLSICLPEHSWKDEKDALGYTEVVRRVVVVGYTPLGTLQVVDYSCAFNPRAYYIKNLFGKIKKNGKAGFLGTADHKPDGKPGERWVFVDQGDGIGLWVDLANEDIFSARETLAQDRQFADRRCLGIARRNALSQHGAMPGKMIGTYEGGFKQAPQSLNVPVFFHRGIDKVESQLVDMANAISAGQVQPIDLRRAGVEVRRIAEPDLTEEDLLSAEIHDELNGGEEEPDTALVGSGAAAVRERELSDDGDDFNFD